MDAAVMLANFGSQEVAVGEAIHGNNPEWDSHFARFDRLFSDRRRLNHLFGHKDALDEYRF
jgi:hypothetical protein